MLCMLSRNPLPKRNQGVKITIRSLSQIETVTNNDPVVSRDVGTATFWHYGTNAGHKA